MMFLQQNIRPDEKWAEVEAKVWGPSGGHCLMLSFKDNMGKEVNFYIHYVSEKNRNEFIGMVKTAIAGLRLNCDSCGQEIK